MISSSRSIAALFVAVLFATTVVVLAPTAAMAGEDDFGGNVNGDKAVIDGTRPSTDPTAPDRESSTPIVSVPKPYKEYRYVPNCSANSVEGGADALCGAAVYTCPVDGDIRYVVYTLQHDADGDPADGAEWERQGAECRGADDPPEGGPAVITVADVRDEAVKAAPKTVVNVEPANRTYVNVPTNFYADDASVDATVQVLGQTIGLTFRPAGYMWKYGDGASASGVGVEGAEVNGPGAVEHAYRRSADVEVTLTRRFDVSYVLPDGTTGTLPAPGVSNTSAPYALDVGEIQSLVTKVR